MAYANATKWVVYTASILCVIFGTCLALAGIWGGATTSATTPTSGTRNCWQLYKACLLEPGSAATSYCADMCDLLCSFHTWHGLLTAGMVLLAIGVLAPAAHFLLSKLAASVPRRQPLLLTESDTLGSFRSQPSSRLGSSPKLPTSISNDMARTSQRQRRRSAVIIDMRLHMHPSLDRPTPGKQE